MILSVHKEIFDKLHSSQDQFDYIFMQGFLKTPYLKNCRWTPCTLFNKFLSNKFATSLLLFTNESVTTRKIFSRIKC